VVEDAALASAYAACQRLAREHYENFPVASRLLPAAMRPHVAAVYAFARIADDYADEGEAPARERHARLAAWRARMHAAASGSAVPQGPHPDVFVALGHTIAACRIPTPLFDDLLSAFEQDVDTTRYGTWADVLDYCRRSANPVGRLVLRIAGRDDAALEAASDALCTALQLANFWQDLAIDWSRGRLYVPAEIYERHGASIDGFDPAALTPAWRAAMSECCGRTRALFARGRGVADGVTGRLRLELRLTWLGGMRIVERLEAAQFNTVRHRPSLGLADAPVLLWRLLLWKAEGGRGRRKDEDGGGVGPGRD
jgi:squalene synthase HpnC